MRTRTVSLNIKIPISGLITCLFILTSFFLSFSQTVETFNFTGAPQYWEVPPCVDTIDVTLAGAKGGGNLGGNGAVVTARIAVSPGQVLELRVGGLGTAGAGGWNGGGNGELTNLNGQISSSGGGGASDIRIAPYNLANRVAVAAGGGGQNGSSNQYQVAGGVGGCATGGNGSGTVFTNSGGSGGTQTAGGAGGPPWGGGQPGQAGSLGQGGNGGSNLAHGAPGGGGGGGYYGGGGGGGDNCCTGANGGGGGAGGSSFVPPLGSCNAGANNGQGYITISYDGGGVGEYEFVIVDPTCVGVNDGSIAFWYTDVNEPDSLEISFDGGFTWGQDTIATGLGVGTYDICVKIYLDTIECETCDVVELVPGPLIPISVSADTTICQNGTANIWAEASDGISFTYFWSHTGNNSGQQSVNPSAATTYSVSAINEIGCTSDTLDINVSLHPVLDGAILPTSETCPGDTVLLIAEASGGIGAPYSFSWSVGGNFIGSGATLAVTPTTTTTYTLTVTDGCETSPFILQHQHIVSVLPPVQISVDDPEQCIPGTFTFTLDMDESQFNSYTWNFSTGEIVENESGFEIFVNQLGEYDVFFEYITTNNCYNSANFPAFYRVTDVPTADFTWLPNPPNMLMTTVFFQNDSQGALNYLWFFQDGAPGVTSEFEPTVIFPLGEVGEYEVTLIAYTEDLCADTITKIVEIVNVPTLYAPNTFTPDGDEYNETWRVYINGVDMFDYHLMLYNRWGEVIWESNDPEAAWDGTYRGRLVQDGTYIWTVSAGDPYTDERYEWKGHVSILR
jgi:gliding motility-associated-like protein